MTRRDFEIATPVGSIAFERTFATRWAPSELPPGHYFLFSTPKPFGGLGSDTGTNWWHNWNAMLMEFPGLMGARTSNGRWIEFALPPTDCGTSTNLLKGSNQTREPTTLQCRGMSGGARQYTLVEADGRRYNFSASHSQTLNQKTRYVLESIDQDGARLVTINYDQPRATNGIALPNCAPSGTTAGAYIRSVRVDSLNLNLDFYYAQSASNSCPVVEIRAREYSVALAAYEYSANGELRVARTGYANQQSLGWGWAAQNIETYCGYGGSFRAWPGAWPNCNPSSNTVATNSFEISSTNNLVTSAATPTETFNIAMTNGGAAQTIWTRSSGSNEPATSVMMVTQTTSLASNNGYHEAFASTQQRDCNVLMSCRGTTAVAVVEQRSSDNKSLQLGSTTKHVLEGQDTAGAMVPIRIQSGGTQVTTSTGPCEGNECESFQWTRVNLAAKVSGETRPSVVQAGATAQTIRFFHSNGLPSKTVETGWTRDATNSVVSRAVATFYRMTPICSGATAETNKIVEVEGPCTIPIADVQTATQCPSTGLRPIVHYKYHQPGALATDVGYLASIRRYPEGCNGALALTQSFEQYHPNGKPVWSMDENGQWTGALHDMGGHLVYITGPQGTWAFDYENDKLVRTVSPTGLNQIYCYRNSTVRPSMPAYIGVRCDGQWTGRLEWVATTDGNAHAASVSFFEAAEYQYGAAKNLRSQTFVRRNDGVRRIRRFDADGRENPSFFGAGNTSVFGETRRYGLNGELSAVGLAFQQPEPFCGTTDTPAAYCTTIGHDGSGRPISVNTPTSASTSSLTKIAYDPAGNTCQMSSDGTTPSCPVGTAPSGSQALITYEHDDFGNIVATWLPGTENGSGPASPTVPIRREFNASGLAIVERTPWLQSTGQHLAHTYDALGRRLVTSVVTGSNASTAAAFMYDTGFAPPAQCGTLQPSNTIGRLSVEADLDSLTYYSYDPSGRLTWEARLWNNRNNRCSVTRYTYRGNGQVERIYYPSGLDVRYVYGVGDRPSSIELTQNGSTQVALSNIVWEPFGGVASYSSPGGSVDYALGQTQATPNGTGSSAWTLPAPSGTCPSGSVGTIDGTGLVRRMNVVHPTSFSPLLTEDYRWGADQLLRSSRCYNGNNGGAPALETTHKYDLALRLKESASTAGGGLGPIGTESWRRDERALQTNGQLDYVYDTRCVAGDPANCPYRLYISRPTDAQPTTKVWSNDFGASPSAVVRGMVKRRTYQYNYNGALAIERYSAYPGDRYALSIPTYTEGPFGYARTDIWGTPYPSATTHLPQSVSIQTSGTPVLWTYAYDSRLRRRTKTSPVQQRSFYSYNQQGQLIEEVRESLTPGAPEVVEEHVYLAGLPIAAIRSLFNPPTATRTTQSSACGGLQHDIGAVSCGTRFVFTEPITGKVSLITDSLARIVWTGEYQPMGARNRQEYWGGVNDTTKLVACDSNLAATPQCGNVTVGCISNICGGPPTGQIPGPAGTPTAFWPGYTGLLPIDQDIAVPTQLRAGLDMKIRVRFAHFDMEPGQDLVQIRDSNNQVQFSLSKYEGGPVRTDWLPMATDVFGVKFLAGSNPNSSYPGKWFAGAHMEGYEWTRFTAGAEPYASPFGPMGMYYDEETEKYLNWHRFYDPFVGRYMAPEPISQRPEWPLMLRTAPFGSGLRRYANDNPTRLADPDGLFPCGGDTVTCCVSRYGPEACGMPPPPPRLPDIRLPIVLKIAETTCPLSGGGIQAPVKIDPDDIPAPDPYVEPTRIPDTNPNRGPNSGCDTLWARAYNACIHRYPSALQDETWVHNICNNEADSDPAYLDCMRRRGN